MKGPVLGVGAFAERGGGGKSWNYNQLLHTTEPLTGIIVILFFLLSPIELLINVWLLNLKLFVTMKEWGSVPIHWFSGLTTIMLNPKRTELSGIFQSEEKHHYPFLCLTTEMFMSPVCHTTRQSRLSFHNKMLTE
jgi:hypothetical protein